MRSNLALQSLSDAIRSQSVKVTTLPATEKFAQEAWSGLRADFSAGRVFDFGVVPDAAIARHAGVGTDRALPDLQPPFHDWRFTFCHARAERNDGSDTKSWPLQITTVHRFTGEHIHFGIFLLPRDVKRPELLYIADVYLYWPVSDIPKYAVATDYDLPPDEKGAFLGDPLIAGLLMLNTRNLEVSEVMPPRAERRRLERKGEKPWTRWSVSTGSYYTAVANVQKHKNNDAKTTDRASPIPHLRRGHWRQTEGGRVWVRDAIINALSPDCPAFVERVRQRVAYRVSSE